jgi:hypothetical protein
MTVFVRIRSCYRTAISATSGRDQLCAESRGPRAGLRRRRPRLRAGSSSTEPDPAGGGPESALETYWTRISSHQFSAAFDYLAPGSLGLSEAQWIAGEKQSRIESVRGRGGP